jgi:serine/threonine protein kinase
MKPARDKHRSDAESETEHAANTLAERVEEAPLPREELLRFALALASQLSEAHALGEHRGTLCLEALEWSGGELLWREEPRTPEQLEQAGALPPECLEDPEPRLPSDARGEIWQAGIVLYRVATGEHPFPAEERDEPELRRDAIAHEHPALPGSLRPEIPLEWDPIVSCCIHKAPRERFADALDLEREIARLQASGGTRRRAPREFSAARLILAALGAALLIAALVWLLR